MADLAISVDVSGVERAQKTLKRFENQIKSLDQRFGRGRSVTSQYNRVLQDVGSTYKSVSTGAKSAGASVNALNRQMNTQTQAVRGSSSAYKGSTRSMNDLGVAMQQTGYQLGDFLVQVQSGTNGFVAFGQQATQMVGILPMFSKTLGVSQTALIGLSAGLGIAIPLLTAFAGAIARTDENGENLNKVLGELQDVLEPVSPLMDEVAKAVTFMKEVTIDAANLVVNNLDRVLSYSVALAGFFTTKWVASFAAARVATFSLAGALVALQNTIRTLLLRTGIGALFVALGEGVYQFVRLIKATGSFGEALNALGPVASAVWQGIVDSAKEIPSALKGVWLSIQSSFQTMVADIIWAWRNLLLSVADSAEGLGEPFKGMANSFYDASNAAAESSNDILASAMSASRESRKALSGVGDNIKDAFAPASEAVKDLRKTLEGGRDSIDIRDWFGLKGGEGEDEGGGSSAADQIVGELNKIEERAQSVANTMKDSMSEAFIGIVEGTKSASDAFMEMARKIVKELFDVLVVQRLVGSFDVASGSGTGIVGSIMGCFPEW